MTRSLEPMKSRPDQKIDAAVALMTAICRAMVEDEVAKGLDGLLAIRTLGSTQVAPTIDVRPVALRSVVRPWHGTRAA